MQSTSRKWKNWVETSNIMNCIYDSLQLDPCHFPSAANCSSMAPSTNINFNPNIDKLLQPYTVWDEIT